MQTSSEIGIPVPGQSQSKHTQTCQYLHVHIHTCFMSSLLANCINVYVVIVKYATHIMIIFIHHRDQVVERKKQKIITT